MVKTVVREHHWTPDYIADLYADEDDWHGLIWWYSDVVACHKELKKK
jgi:hypothetical protein